MQPHSYQHEGSKFGGTPYRITFYLWRHSPRWFRSAFSASGMAKELKNSLRNQLAKHAGRDDIYNQEYYVYVDAQAARSAPVIVRSLVARFTPRHVADVGCGTGALLSEFRVQGVEGTGFEYSAAALQICRQRGLNVHRFNIEEKGIPHPGCFDLVTCFEVAEHLSADSADPLVELLSRLAPIVIFTAATPGQGGGADHINEQPHEYWIEKFEHRGYRLDRSLTDDWRSHWEQAGVASFYARNLMIFADSSHVRVRLDKSTRSAL